MSTNTMKNVILIIISVLMGIDVVYRSTYSDWDSIGRHYLCIVGGVINGLILSLIRRK